MISITQKRIKMLLTAVIIALIPSCLLANNIQISKVFPPPSLKTSYFIVQTADKAILRPNHLTLVGINPKNIWFADAPSSLAGMISTQHYMNVAWATPKSSFNVVHPNASLAGFTVNLKTGQRERINLILTLKSAHFYPKTNTVFYSVNKLLFAHSMKEVNATILVEQPTLFIDTVPPGGYPVLSTG